ncbi:MAG: hypothetical protein KDB22_25630, partial [Planctomycetales bacterium]|nr:hypothetical protein [Planctomycetales bacterium]
AAFATGVLTQRVQTWSIASATLALMASTALGPLLFNWLPWWPELHWQWLPILVLFAGTTGLVPALSQQFPQFRVKPGESVFKPLGLVRLVSILVIAGLTAYLLVPDWQRLDNVRVWYVVGLASVIFIVSCLSSYGVQRSEPALPALLLFSTGLAVGILLFLSGSLKFAQLAGLPTAAGAAWWLLAGRSRLTSDSLAVAAPAFIAVITGLLFCGYINSFSSLPVACYAIVVLAPASLGLRAVRRTGLARESISGNHQQIDRQESANQVRISAQEKNRFGWWSHFLPLAVALVWAITVSVMEDS